MSATATSIEQLAINTIRTLAMDAVQKANSGHPGTPMALAPAAYVLFQQSMRYDPSAPLWPGRDRFILSCGHASMLLYAMLHLSGVRGVDDRGNVLDGPSITLDNIKNFRQLGSPCAGHPEYGDAAGIETTTGPLGQGVGNSVGMAIAAKWLAARYDRPGFELFGFNVYALCSDGDLMEGVGCEAASVAGHLKLSNLCWVYDDNHITIEGNTRLAFSEDVATRFRGLGWNVVKVDDANDVGAINRALDTFRKTDDKPTLIIVRSVIAWGSPNKADTHGAHGAALGEDEVKITKEFYGWPAKEHFYVPDEVYAHYREGIGKRGRKAREEWEAEFAKYESAHPQEAAALRILWSGRLPEGWDADIPEFAADAKGMATRVSSGKVLTALGGRIPWFLGGSADLAPSTMTPVAGKGESDFEADNYAGRILHFGVREHVMGSIANGMSLTGLRPFVGTFFVFTDYMRPAMRLASIMHRPVLYILTHDSIGLGEDGPTHQPIEHLAACRAIPGLLVVRPGDANEVAAAYRTLLSITDRPAALVLSRQNVPTLNRAQFAPAEGLARGAYVLCDPPQGEPQVILIGTGTELPICVSAWETLASEGIAARVVSMPCWELFDEQSQSYRDSVLPPNVTARVAVEAAAAMGWERYIGPRGRFVGMSSFGASAPAGALYKHFGITPERVAAEAKAALAQESRV